MALYGPYNDKELLRNLNEGDAGAFAEIYERYWDKLLIYVMKGVRRQEDAEDIVQELFVSIWRRRGDLDIAQALSTYLFNSARYAAMRHISQNITKYKHLETLAASLGKDGGSDSLGIEALIFSRELEGKIDGAIGQLPEKMREVFLLSRREQLSYKEIAERLSISEETVRKQIYKALQILRDQLGNLPVVALICLLIYY
jgi:RNA polymerase sigma-70 factor (family 1)